MSTIKSFERLTAAQVISEASVCVPNNKTKAVLAIFTDEVRWLSNDEFETYMQDPSRMSCLLEVRAYNSTCEFHAIRSNINESFAARLRIDTAESDSTAFHVDEVQYLDIDTTAPNTDPSSGRYQSIAGGAYTLPVLDASLVTVRNYYEFNEHDGLARLVDFRIVGFGDRREASSDA